MNLLACDSFMMERDMTMHWYKGSVRCWYVDETRWSTDECYELVSNQLIHDGNRRDLYEVSVFVH